MLCRVCLCSDRQVTTFKNTVLQQVWQKLTNAELNSSDGKPLEVCYICCAHLKKSYQLMQKASKAEALLTVLAENGLQHTHNAISRISTLVGDFDYNYVIKEELKYECTKITRRKMAEVKKEIDENNEEEIDIRIKEEEDWREPSQDDDIGPETVKCDTPPVRMTLKKVPERKDGIVLERTEIDCWDSSQDDDIRPETVRCDDASPVQMTLKKLPEKNDGNILERIDIGITNRKRKLLVLPQNAGISKLDEPNNVWKPVSDGILKSQVVSAPSNFEAVKNEEIKAQNVLPQTEIEQAVGYNVTENEISKQNLTKSTTADAQISLLVGTNEENHMQYKHIKMKNFSCHICQYKCVTKSKLIVHLRKHTKEKPYKCDLCDYRCSIKPSLNSHMQFKHIKEKKFSCYMCEYKCVTKGGLNMHLRKHTKEKPYQCDLCDYKGSCRSSLNSHMRYKHTKEKRYSCNICKYKSVAKGNLNIHLRKHTKEKLYGCDLCDYRCSCKSSLISHMQHKHIKEKNFSCHMCQYKCVTKGALNMHLRKHTKEKPYTCNLCDYRCALKGTLNRHIQFKHIKEKNFSCHMCQYKCATKGALNIHLRKHAREETIHVRFISVPMFT